MCNHFSKEYGDTTTLICIHFSREWSIITTAHTIVSTYDVVYILYKQTN